MSGATPLVVVLIEVDGTEIELGRIERSSPCDLASVAVLARMKLAATRAGRAIRLTELDPALRDLIVLVGLADSFDL